MVVLLYRNLVVAVYDPKWFREVVDKLRRRGIKFSFYYTLGEVPEYSVVYTDSSEIRDEVGARRDLTVVYDPERTCRGLEKAVLASLMKSEYGSLTIGVDPGSRHAFIALGDSVVVDWGFMDDLVGKVRELVECVPATSVVVRVGAHGRGLEIARDVKIRVPGVRVELVSEYNTTPSHSRASARLLLKGLVVNRQYLRGNKDVLAALRIALKQGVEVL
ncbi:hypothetical protein TCELL_0127 [Thermogladius calderae 1633]|uniref:Uncharacterized protein n=1 Tax=Thermogladius calderae (strain DSM 22663 / VKM B-2946 / 1633) TaxID=1184251 RepID=I3TCR4_THEC1|nr:hypothetical protein [Thermogladius calderae]AFK50552.1 hypothetical protein TCELL_0127 [Thermogladius calderae 1633]